jgi:hypothetical protein
MKRERDRSPQRKFIHYNLEATNNTNKGTVFNVEQRVTNVLPGDNRDYCLAIERLVINGGSIPILTIPPTVFPYDEARSDNRFSVSCVPTGGGGPTYYDVIYDPLTNIQEYGLNTVFSYESFSVMITTALIAAFNQIPFAGTNKPKFYFSPQTKIFTLAIPDDTVLEAIEFSTSLYMLFNNFYTTKGSTEGYFRLIKDVEPLNRNPINGGVNSLVPIGYTIATQEYEALFNVQQFVAIVFRSSRLGIAPEYSPGANVSSDLIQSNNASGVTPSSSILTDLIPYLGTGDQSGIRGYQYYTPSLYRWIDILGTSFDVIDLQIFVKDKVGNEYPYLIPPFGTAKVKIIFAHKDYIY